MLPSVTLGYDAIRGDSFADQRSYNSLGSSLRELEIAISAAYIVGIAANLHAYARISRDGCCHLVQLLLRLRPELARSRVELEINVTGYFAPDGIGFRGDSVGGPRWHGSDFHGRRSARTEKPDETQWQRQDGKGQRPTG